MRRFQDGILRAFVRITRGNINLRAAFVMTISAAFLLSSFMACAESTEPAASRPALSTGFRFIESSGEELFANVCRGCHMPDGKGAAGAGTYPSLVANKTLEAGGYAVDLVVNGQRAMPPFGAMMSDDQVAAVVNYLRTHFDNHYQDAVTAADVQTVRR
jgi:mono/diheme cytochrome c family protein